MQALCVQKSPSFFIKSVSFFAMIILACFAGPAFAELPANPANIILIMTDDMGYGDVGFNGMSINGNSTTPHLDQLATEGMKFTHFYAGGPVCSPTRATCLTGRHYWRHGIWEANTGRLSDNEITIPDVLQNMGYATGHFGKWHIGSPNPNYNGSGADKNPPYPQDFGYDEHFLTHHSVLLFDPFGPSGTVVPDNNPYWHNGTEAVHGNTVNVSGSADTYNLTGDDSRIMMDQVVPFIERSVAAGKPFFAVVWFHTPHKDVAADPKWQTLYEPHVGGKWEYHGSISGMDEQVGRMRTTLQNLNVDQDTMIWFTSDNGPLDTNSTDGLRGKKRSLFNGGVNMPAFLYWPGHVASGTIEDEFCSTLDYLPTIFDYLNYTMPDARPIDGTSLLPLIEGQSFQRSKSIPFTFQHNYGHMNGSPVCSMIEEGFKFMTNSPNSANGGPEEVMHYIPNDRYEEDNLVFDPVNASMISSMRAQLEAFLVSAENSWNGDDYNDPSYSPANSNFRNPRTGWKDGDPSNFPPTFISNPFSMANASVGVPYAGSLSPTASTPVSFDPDGDSLTFSKLNGQGWLSVASNGTLSGTPTAGDLGLNEFLLQCSDGNGGTDQARLQIQVYGSGVNTPPSVVINGDKPREVIMPPAALNVSVSLDATVSDDDLPDPPNLTIGWTVEIKPVDAVVSFDPGQDVEDVTVTMDTPGSYTLKLLADDGALTGEDTILINVIDGGANTPPTVVINGDKPRVAIMPPGTLSVDVTIDSTVTDDNLPEPASLTIDWTVEAKPTGATVIFDPNEHAEDVTVTIDTLGSYTLKLTANDGEFFNEDTIVINVTDEVVSELILSPVDDTFINSVTPDTNYGAAGKVELSDTKFGYMKFDLNAAATIDSATLTLTCVKNGSTTEIYTADHSGSGQWLEGSGDGTVPDATGTGLTWTNNNVVQGSLLDSQITASGAATVFDVTNLVVGPDGKATLLIKVASGKAHFAAKENSTDSKRPILTVTSSAAIAGDLTGNGKVDLEDQAILSEGWQSIYSLTDLMDMAVNWLK